MLNQLTAAIDHYTQALKTYVQSRTGAVAVAETAVIAANAARTYNLTTLLGANHAQYDKLSAVIVVKVLDTDANAPTSGLYINSEAVITTGVDAEGSVVIHNHHTAAVTCYIRIDVPLVAANPIG